MDVIIAFLLCFVLLVFSVLKGIFVALPLGICFFIFFVLALKKGYKWKDILGMAYRGGKKSFVALRIFILIGAIISTWMSAGTVPAIVYYGMKLIAPNLFILSAFLITCFVAYLIGTSFGTVGTVGIALIVMARGGGTSVPAAAGAILAGAYFGDRCSPMSSSANLVAELTHSDLYVNIKNMFRTSIIPFILSVIIYTFISFKYPLTNIHNNIGNDILKIFNVNIIVLIPAAIILLLAALKVDVKKSILISTISAIIISVFMQGETVINVIKYIFLGFTIQEDTPLKAIIKGGGIFSMLKAALVVFIPAAFTGIFQETGMLRTIENLVLKAKNRYELFFMTIVISIITGAFGCTQVMSVIMTNMLTEKAYKKHKLDGYKMALDLENSAIVIAALIPWNIAVLVPLTNLMAGFNAIPYAVYLYLLPIVNLLWFRFEKQKESTNTLLAVGE